MPNHQELQARVLALLQAGHALSVRWDCGNDESLLFVELDGVELPFDYTQPGTDLAVSLSDYLLELLELPGVGPFELRGGGQILQEGAELVLEYQSEYIDYEGDWLNELSDEQRAALDIRPAPGTEPAGMIDPGMSEDYSGRQVLFESES